MSTADNIFNQKEGRYPGVWHRGYVHFSHEINQQRPYVVVLESD